MGEHKDKRCCLCSFMLDAVVLAVIAVDDEEV